MLNSFINSIEYCQQHPVRHVAKMKLKHLLLAFAVCFLVNTIRDVSSQSASAAVTVPVLKIVPGKDPGTLEVSWDTVVGTTYQLQFSITLTNWIDLGPPVSGDGNKIIATQYPGTTATFYRVQAY
ncbi:MAG: hypothetical protein JWQ71_2298 [Pedosphaera sp.]|nr:hypothetical protein [Pedosphaera sp.]